MRATRLIFLLAATLPTAITAFAATYQELSERAVRRPATSNGNANGMSYGQATNGGVATAYPGYGNTAMYMLPMNTGNGMPDARLVRWSYGQVNAASDPFYIWGLRSQGMYVPWSTPMSGWTKPTKTSRSRTNSSLSISTPKNRLSQSTGILSRT